MELVLKGQIFRKGGVKALVFTMHQVRVASALFLCGNHSFLPHAHSLPPPSLPPSLLPQPSDSDLDSAQPFSSNYLVELSAFASSNQDRASDELRNFAEYLKPYPTNNLCHAWQQYFKSSFIAAVCEYTLLL